MLRSHSSSRAARQGRLAALALSGIMVALFAGRVQAQQPAHHPAIERAADSTLRIISFANPGTRAPKKLETQSLPRLSMASFSFPMAREQRIAFQAEACRLSGMAWCPIFDEEARGTAFSVEKPGRFMTCRHLFHDWYYWARLFNPERPLRSLVPPFVLVDRKEKLVFVSTGPTGGGYRVTLMMDDARLNAPMAQLTRADLIWDADIFAFDLMEGMGVAPLAIGSVPERGQRIAFIGYPDSNGALRALVSGGAVAERRGVASVTTAASAKGMSGGPVLDLEGRAKGLSCALGRDTLRSGRTAYVLPLSLEALERGLQGTHGVPFRNLAP